SKASPRSSPAGVASTSSTPRHAPPTASWWALVDARDSDQLRTNRLELAALNATATVRAYFADTLVPATRVTSVVPYEEALPAPQLLRIHASFALGVAARCCRLLERQPFSGQLEQVR